MERNKPLFFIIGIVLIVLIGNITLGLFLSKNFHSSSNVSISPTPVQKLVNYFSYKGEVGKDALTILKEKARTGQESSGLISSINGRKAESSRREYWAFYVNGTMAEVGPADYKTKDEDMIEWKIEKY